MRPGLLLKGGQICLVGDVDVADGQGGVVRAVEDVLHVGVVDDLDVFAGVDDGGGADADLLDGAAEAVDLHDVAHVVLVLKEHEGAGDQVGDQALRAEAQHQSQNAHGGDDGGQIHPQDAQAPAEDHDERHILEEARAQGQQGAAAVGLRVEETQHQHQQRLRRQHGEGHGAGLGQGTLGGLEDEIQPHGQRGEERQTQQAGKGTFVVHREDSSQCFIKVL